MIKIWYRHRGRRPSKTKFISEDAHKSSTLPPSFTIAGVEYGRLIDGSVETNLFAIRVDSDSIPQDAIDSIAIAFEDNWGGTIEFVESVQV